MWGEDPDLFGPKDWFRNTLLVRKVRRHVPSGEIIDYGCGTGICIRRLLPYGYEFTAIDPSPQNIRYLKHHLRDNPRVRIRQGGAAELRQISRPVDGIICGETLEHVEDDVSLVQLFRDCLKPGGRVLASVPAHQSRWSEIDSFVGHFRRYDKESLRKLFASNGFSVEEVMYYGFPLGLMWDKLVADPIMRKKIRTGVVYTRSRSLLGYAMRVLTIKKAASLVFYLDFVFRDNPRGTGLILVAKKSAS
jgi:SAM-dependent methyltransferase